MLFRSGLFAGFKSVGYFFAVVEVIFDGSYCLSCFVTLSGEEYHVAGTGFGDSPGYGLASVGDSDCALELRVVESGTHIGQNSLGVFETGIIGSEHEYVGALGGGLCHERTFAVVAVAAGTAYGDYAAVFACHLANGVEHVDESVGGVGVVRSEERRVGKECRL